MTDQVAEKVATDMLMVAGKLEEFSRMYDAFDPSQTRWTASQLRHEALVIRASGGIE